MKKSLTKFSESRHSKIGSLFKQFILGSQDGLVNVLGVVLGIAIATGNEKLAIVAGLAATFAESVSMAAVEYTSGKAEQDYYKSEQAKEMYEIKCVPEKERKEIYEIYHKKGFRGKLLNDIVKNITSNKKRWVDIMMKEELELSGKFINPSYSAFIVGISTIVGSLIPVIPFFFMKVFPAIFLSLALSAVFLFIAGAL
jgi:VIT1/CCC1 family predicted Fe2+/Mn2+ transporter